MVIHLRVGPRGGCKGELVGVLYDDPAGDVQIESAGGGGMHTQLLTRQHKLALTAALEEHGTRHRTTQDSAQIYTAASLKLPKIANPYYSVHTYTCIIHWCDIKGTTQTLNEIESECALARPLLVLSTGYIFHIFIQCIN